MRRFLLRLGLCGMLAWGGGAPARADETFQLDAPVPDWVAPLDPDAIPDAAPTDVDNGIEYILIDQQARADTHVHFYHDTRRVVDRHGLQDAAEIREEYDPAYQTFALHWLRIKRDGAWQDRLHREKIQTLRREENLDSQMLDGRLSVLCHLQDVRVGDEIDYAYSITGANPIFDGKLATAFSTGWSTPVRSLRHRLLVPAGRAVAHRSYGYTLEPTRAAGPEGLEEWVWQKENVPPVYEEPHAPAWYDAFGWVQVSEYRSWQEVVDWALNLYAVPPLSPALQQRVDAIAQAHAEPEDRALAAVRLVQDEIRYLGIEMGAGSYRPTPPDQVYDARFGDCKGKAFLCVALLRALGIEAYPVLVNTDERHAVGRLLPSPLAFDHVIVQAIVQGHPYWIDATRADQRGRLQDLYTSNFGLGLVIRPGNTELSPLETSPAAMPREVVEDIFTVKEPDAPASLQVHSVFYGNLANEERALFAESPSATLQKKFVHYYANTFPKIEAAAPLAHQDFPDENRFEVWENYTIPGLWKRESATVPWTAYLTPILVRDLIGSLPSPQRKAPYATDHPIDVTENITAHLFKPWRLASAAPIEIATPWFTFTDSSALQGRDLHFNYHYRTLQAEVAAKDMEEYRAKLAKAKDDLGDSLTYTPPSATPTAPASLEFNWLGSAFAVLWLLVLVYAAWRIHARRSIPPVPLPEGLEAYEGVRGWLFLVLFSLVCRAGLAVKNLLTNSVLWNAAKWRALTVPGQEAYHSLWAPSLLMEFLFTALFAVFSILAIVCLLRRKRVARPLIIFLLAATIVAAAADWAFIHPFLPDKNTMALQTLAQSVGAGALWIPYFLFSKRVRATFRF